MNFLSCINDYIEDMATFTALVKIYSTEYFCNTKVARLGEIFVKENFHVYGKYKIQLLISKATYLLCLELWALQLFYAAIA